MAKLTPERIGPILIRPMAQRDGRARWRAEWYPAQGAGKMTTRSLSKARGERITKDEAVGRAIELLAAGIHLEHAATRATVTVDTVLDLLEVWLGDQADRIGVDLARSTFATYESRCRRLARDPFADIRLDEVNPTNTRALFRRLRAASSDRTLKALWTTLRTVWRWAIHPSRELVHADLPRISWSPDPRPQHIPTDEDVATTLDALHAIDRGARSKAGSPTRLRRSQALVAVEVLWGTGARPRELAIADARDFDLTRRVWTVRGQEGSKTGWRRVPLSSMVAEVVEAHLGTIPSDGPMFPPRLLSLGNRLNHWISVGAAAADIEPWTCKGLRHLAITNMLVAGMEAQTVARVVGNSPQTIWRSYAQVLAGRPEACMETIGRRPSNVIPLRSRS